MFDVKVAVLVCVFGYTEEEAKHRVALARVEKMKAAYAKCAFRYHNALKELAK